MCPSTWFHPLLLTLLRACSGGHEKPLQSIGKETSFSSLCENLCHRSMAFMSKSAPSSVGFGAMGVSAFSPCCSCCVRPWTAGSSSYWGGGGGTCGGSHWLKEHWARRDTGMPTKKKKKQQTKIVLGGLQMKAWWGKIDHPVGMARNVRENQKDMEGAWVWLHHINQ